jgi:hypothetical protein
MILQISSTPLSLGMQGDDVARVHQALQVLGRDIPVAETADRVMGTGTVAVLTALQADLSLPTTGIVDATTDKVINTKDVETHDYASNYIKQEPITSRKGTR